MALRKYPNCDIWYILYRDFDGKVRTRTTETANRRHALAKERLFMAMFRAERLRRKTILPQEWHTTPILPPVPGDHRHGGIQLSRMWDIASQKRILSASHRKTWNRFIREIGVKFADQVTPALAQKYLTDRFSNGNGKTFNNNRTILNTIFRCCLIEANLTQSPFSLVINKRIARIEHHRNINLETEFPRICSEGDPLSVCMSMISRWTCQRLKDCALISPSMLDRELKVIILQPGKTSRFKKWVCVPLFPELERYLDSIPQPCSPDTPYVTVFGYTTGGAFCMRFRRLLNRLKIFDSDDGKASFHSLRGSGITWLQEQGWSAELIRKTTGHTNDEITDIYSRDRKNISVAVQLYAKQIAKSM